MIGRQKTFRIGFSINVLGIGCILFSSSYAYVILGLFLVGLASTVRTAVGYVYGLEFIETRN